MSSAERFLQSQEISAAYIWCYPELVGYYNVVNVPTGGYKEVRFMRKSL